MLKKIFFHIEYFCPLHIIIEWDSWIRILYLFFQLHQLEKNALTSQSNKTDNLHKPTLQPHPIKNILNHPKSHPTV